jgi:hypothetical protein
LGSSSVSSRSSISCRDAIERVGVETQLAVEAFQIAAAVTISGLISSIAMSLATNIL